MEAPKTSTRQPYIKPVETLHINLWAGAGTGKSTTAAAVFAELKYRDQEVELIREYAKELIWDNNKQKLGDTLHIIAEQHSRHRALEGKVEYTVTDSPIPLVAIYARDLTRTTRAMVMQCFEYSTLNILLKRTKPYHQNGRLQTASEAAQFDVVIKEYMDKHRMQYIELYATQGVSEYIADLAMATKQ